MNCVAMSQTRVPSALHKCTFGRWLTALASKNDDALKQSAVSPMSNSAGILKTQLSVKRNYWLTNVISALSRVLSFFPTLFLSRLLKVIFGHSDLGSGAEAVCWQDVSWLGW